MSEHEDEIKRMIQHAAEDANIDGAGPKYKMAARIGFGGGHIPACEVDTEGRVFIRDAVAAAGAGSYGQAKIRVWAETRRHGFDFELEEGDFIFVLIGRIAELEEQLRKLTPA